MNLALSLIALVGLSCGSTLPFQSQHAPGLAPHGVGVERTYTITTIIKLLRPCDPSTMTDAYQDAKVISDEGNCLTVSITYFPMNDKVRSLRKQIYSTVSGNLKRYLLPTVTCNWDEAMRADLIKTLKEAGIDPTTLKPAELVSKVASWAFQTSSFSPNSDAMPSDWFVSFDGKGPHVYEPTREAFRQSHPNSQWTDQDVFDHQLLGRQMFAAKSHGACTSSSIYLATILRALGIPTRILYFIPPCDGNDVKQVKLLSAAISRNVTRQKIIDGVTVATGFANHMYNEVWIDGRWQRLNYSSLGQETVDENYLGLMTHIDTCADISETHLAETWGLRSDRWPNVAEKLSSVNPYQLVAAADHWGKEASRENPEASELKQATVIDVLWPKSPGFVELVPDANSIPKTDFLLQIKEWIPGRSYIQMREFISGADTEFLLRAPGHPDIPLHYNGLNCSNSSKRGFAVAFDSQAPVHLIPGVQYLLVPRNQKARHEWRVVEGFKVIAP